MMMVTMTAGMLKMSMVMDMDGCWRPRGLPAIQLRYMVDYLVTYSWSTFILA